MNMNNISWLVGVLCIEFLSHERCRSNNDRGVSMYLLLIKFVRCNVEACIFYSMATG